MRVGVASIPDATVTTPAGILDTMSTVRVADVLAMTLREGLPVLVDLQGRRLWTEPAARRGVYQAWGVPTHDRELAVCWPASW